MNATAIEFRNVDLAFGAHRVLVRLSSTERCGKIASVTSVAGASGSRRWASPVLLPAPAQVRTALRRGLTSQDVLAKFGGAVVHVPVG